MGEIQEVESARRRVWVAAAIVGSAPGRRGEDPAADQAALARVTRGERDALAELYDRHARPIYSLALRILRDTADAEDVVQDVFAQAWSQASRYARARGTVSAWLLMLARSRAIDRLRSKRSRPDLGAGDDGVVADVPDTGATPDRQLLSDEQVSRVRIALSDLPGPQRVAVEMAYYEGLSHTEIADQLDEPLGTVKTRIRTAMNRLRESLMGAR